jgi:hypothetical protein
VLRQAAAAPAVNGGGSTSTVAPVTGYGWIPRRGGGRGAETALRLPWRTGSTPWWRGLIAGATSRWRGGCLTSAHEVERHSGACLALRADDGRREAGSGGVWSSVVTADRAVGGAAVAGGMTSPGREDDDRVTRLQRRVG